ncbi:hypothetical protein [Nocardioides marmoribigeumensis]|uniref:Uncharacterized protein Yka (UPF0111/DUF47 family) n=1 Tax=Nocardioides marmoribigeumensis TaxID=433649 RepID=A0ABU2BRV0_9ACTN|nr:hypothetical protein [Nocardioides marmoribigeumensis]MDR7361351.1 uncharacterized protein Yka (UPF0111/DUF47 family) [Nocardioides marmoribigeumensis]
MKRHWFLPENPDVLATLGAMADAAADGTTAFAAWASGDGSQDGRVRECGQRVAELRRTLGLQLREAFSTPVDQEDLYTLGERLVAVVAAEKNVVREAEIWGLAPDEPLAAMAQEALDAVVRLRVAVGELGRSAERATAQADAAVECEGRMEQTYRVAMRALLDVADVREMTARAELYRRTLEVGERISRVADRVWYAVVKEA